MAPVADCYLPERRPPLEVAHAEHRQMAEALAAAGCDLLLVETICASDEGLAAIAAAAATGLPVWAAAMTMPEGRMRDGSDLRKFFRDARAAGASAALINCVPCDGVDIGLPAALESGLPCGGYAHMGEVDANGGWLPSPVLTPAEYALRAARWMKRGATIFGGCCGTTPAHVAALRPLSLETACRST
jgi:S-methylmethionine-dependent homocysteine/selenocysteine methylase